MFKFIKRIKNKSILYCEAMASRLVFFDKKVAYCSNGNPSQNRAYPIIFDNFDADICFDVKKLANEIKKNRKNIRKGKIINSCIGCPNIQNKEVDIVSKDLSVSYIQFSDYGICNSKCVYCNSWTNTKFEDGEYKTKDGKKDSYNILPIIEELIKNRILTKDTTIDFAGGEPTLYKQFSNALNYLMNFGIKNILVFSNIIDYSQEIENGIKNGIINLIVSIDAGTKEIHEKVKGVTSYEKVYSHLEKYASVQKYKNQVISKYVIVENLNDNIAEVLIWIEKSKQIGINKLIINADNRIFESTSPPKEDTINKLKSITNEFIKKCKEYNLDYEIYSNIKYVEGL